jgi:hypothetical protein
LEKLFIAVGNTELSNKMAMYTADKEAFISTYSSCGFYVAVETEYGREFSVRAAPSTDTLSRITEQSEERGIVCVCVCVCDKRAKRHKQFCLSFA